MYKSKTNQWLLFIEYLNENRPKNLEILSSPKIRFFDMDYGFFYVGNVRNVERLFSRLEKVKTARRPQLVFDEFLTIINHSCWKLGWPRWWPEKERHFEENWVSKPQNGFEDYAAWSIMIFFVRFGFEIQLHFSAIKDILMIMIIGLVLQ